jgi:hypothetical protein
MGLPEKVGAHFAAGDDEAFPVHHRSRIGGLDPGALDHSGDRLRRYAGVQHVAHSAIPHDRHVDHDKRRARHGPDDEIGDVSLLGLDDDAIGVEHCLGQCGPPGQARIDHLLTCHVAHDDVDALQPHEGPRLLVEKVQLARV